MSRYDPPPTRQRLARSHDRAVLAAMTVLFLAAVALVCFLLWYAAPTYP